MVIGGIIEWSIIKPFFPILCQPLGAHYIPEWRPGRLIKCKSVRENERTIFSEYSVSLLELIISQSGVQADSQNVRVLERMKELSSLNDIRAFLGLVGYYQNLIRVFKKCRTSLEVTK